MVFSAFILRKKTLSYVVTRDSPDCGVSSPPITKSSSNKSIQKSKQVIHSAGGETEEKVIEGLMLLFPALHVSSGLCPMNVLSDKILMYSLLQRQISLGQINGYRIPR